MTGKRFKFNGRNNCIEYDGKSILLDSYGEDIEELLNELNECNNSFIGKTVELIKEYLDVADEQEGILLGNAPVERAYALIELLKELGLNDLLKEKGIELLEDDDND